MTIKLLYSPVISENVTSYELSESILRQNLNGVITDYDISNLETEKIYYSDDRTVQVFVEDEQIKIVVINFISADATEDEKIPGAFVPELVKIESENIVQLNADELVNQELREEDKLKAQIEVLENQLAFQSDVLQVLAMQVYE